MSQVDAARRRRGGGDEGGGRERAMVPKATFTSYYGRPVVKPSPWEADIPAYLFLGGLAGASSMLAAGADATGRPRLRRASRAGALGAVTLSLAALVHDLGRPERFLNMLRVVKPTSPMSVGTWLLTPFGALCTAAALGEAAPLLRPRWAASLARATAPAAGAGAAVLGAGVASYTAVLLADTATPAWHEARHELPYLFVGSAAAAAGGFGMLAAPLDEAAPARRLATVGAVVELATERLMEQRMGIVAETLHGGRAGQLLRAARYLSAAGALVTAVGGRRSRALSAAAGAALLAGSACTRFGVFEAGQDSARDPRYTVVPQRARVEAAGQPS